MGAEGLAAGRRRKPRRVSFVPRQTHRHSSKGGSGNRPAVRARAYGACTLCAMPSPPGRERPPRRAAASPRTWTWRRAAEAFSGPMLIAVAVVVVLRDVAFGGLITLGDISTYF